MNFIYVTITVDVAFTEENKIEILCVYIDILL